MFHECEARYPFETLQPDADHWFAALAPTTAREPIVARLVSLVRFSFF